MSSFRGLVSSLRARRELRRFLKNHERWVLSSVQVVHDYDEIEGHLLLDNIHRTLALGRDTGDYKYLAMTSEIVVDALNRIRWQR